MCWTPLAPSLLHAVDYRLSLLDYFSAQFWRRCFAPPVLSYEIFKILRLMSFYVCYNNRIIILSIACYSSCLLCVCKECIYRRCFLIFHILCMTPAIKFCKKNLIEWFFSDFNEFFVISVNWKRLFTAFNQFLIVYHHIILHLIIDYIIFNYQFITFNYIIVGFLLRIYPSSNIIHRSA